MSKEENETPESFFSEDLVDCFQRIQRTRSKGEKVQLMMEFAETFAAEYDSADHTANENYHEFIEQFERARLEFQQASMKLARMGVDFMESVLAEHPPMNETEQPIRTAGRRLN